MHEPALEGLVRVPRGVLVPFLSRAGVLRIPGKAYFLDDIGRLEGIYAEIEEELRSRYLLAYQSTSTKEPSEFRAVSVEVDAKGADVRSMSGYYP